MTIGMIYTAFERFDIILFCKTNILGTTMVPMVLKCHLIVLELLSSNFLLRLLIRFYDQMWYPGGTQNVVFETYIISDFQRKINHPYSLLRSELRTHKVLMNFSNSDQIWKISFFRVKLCQNYPTLYKCKNTSQLHNEKCERGLKA